MSRKAIVHKVHGYVKSVVHGDPAHDAVTENLIELNDNAILPAGPLNKWMIIGGDFVEINSATPDFAEGEFYKFEHARKCNLYNFSSGGSLAQFTPVPIVSFVHVGDKSTKGRLFGRFAVGVKTNGAFPAVNELTVTIDSVGAGSPVSLACHLRQSFHVVSSPALLVFEFLTKETYPEDPALYSVNVTLSEPGTPATEHITIGDVFMD